ncbi:3-oxoacyl-[acyl-carrier protein] reductase [Pseudooceanicola batsensis HTCC2597]|uniref:3-oxoacyl-[acyl-carrier protein] reductase n=1 Tax=Pseudooceanicola batsensis (strain ATCC BAA-863 / DSM 15984 / KCTC 12145 / HTCC2597) TaxID=252305 RepID=A3U1B9_PSEBH|nr:SDR family NAD(P)-dependent oxidoreductase [Pseudooceanicola batsensis]EAQ02102.1 3-oxoacyl-[acyl-carrier protein] reductase [Pseudooceanicola batsensis HTCC2597]
MITKRTALVTGAARGIGLSIATDLAEKGHRVILADILPEVEAVARDLSGDTHGKIVDLSQLGTIGSVVAGLTKVHGPIGVLVNNAGISPKCDGKRASFETLTLAEWQSVLDVNLSAAFLLCQAVLPGMRQQGWGRIVNMASQAARTRSLVAGFHYAASKAGLVGLSRTLAAEVGSDGITVNCIAPGRIDTPMAAEAGAAVNAAYVQTIPAGRIGTPEDVAAAAAYFASDEAGFVTGTVLDVNGGHFMG